MFKEMVIKKKLLLQQLSFLAIVGIFFPFSADAYEEEEKEIYSPTFFYGNKDVFLPEEDSLFTKEEIAFLMDERDAKENESSLPSSFSLEEHIDVRSIESFLEEHLAEQMKHSNATPLGTIQPVKNLYLEEAQIPVSSLPTKITIQYLPTIPHHIKNSDFYPPIAVDVFSPTPSSLLPQEYCSFSSSVLYPTPSSGAPSSSQPSSSSPSLPRKSIKKNEITLKKPIHYTFIKETPMIKKSRKNKKRTEWKFHDYSEKSFC